MTTVKPLSPKEVADERLASMPDAVIEIFNALIAEKFNGRSAMVLQRDVVARLMNRGHAREKIFRKGWLNVEGIYRKQGWKVVYDKPGYNESYEANFTFSKN